MSRLPRRKKKKFAGQEIDSMNVKTCSSNAFWQGASLASEFIARHLAKYGGLAALSGGLIGKGDHLPPENYRGDLQKTPIFSGAAISTRTSRKSI